MSYLLSLALALHLLSAVIWVGGMFFAHRALRPVAATLLEPPQRLPLWVGTFGNFFPWVWAAIIALPASGYFLIFKVYGGFANAPLFVHIMNGLGLVMILIFLHVFFAPYRRLKKAVAAGDFPAGAKSLAQIRVLIGINMLIGLAVVAIAGAGRYFV